MIRRTPLLGVSRRYPDTLPEGAPYKMYTLEEARRTIEYARRIIEYCEDLLSRVQ